MEMGKLKPATGETDNRAENKDLRKGVRQLIYHFKMCVLGIYWPVEVSLNLDGTARHRHLSRCASTRHT